ncbi:hypothetical protein [Thiobacillus sp.]|jgi:methionyl-tRNA formyltransferase|uniref:hypothetical protein n=1 Tax=Thiobacillus sp. TaxID=924 RepID=UPI0025D3FF0E|nr:hypothetical protein [Thiobacillus sp.]
MKITVLCSSSDHPVNVMLQAWIARHQDGHEISLVRSKKELGGGDLLFLISCDEIITGMERKKFTKTLVIHASDLPKGRGWSPHIWEILNGAEEITVALLEAEDKVDAGAIWKKIHARIPKHALYDEINEILFGAESQLMDFAVEQFVVVQPQPQNPSVEPSYYPRRKPADSEINPNQTLASQFDLLRVCDPARFPAHFSIHGHRYRISIEKIEND